jgi:methylated-DNA-[protein]-cysteine S-methyltransferase
MTASACLPAEFPVTDDRQRSIERPTLAFDTAFGRCRLSWSSNGLTRLRLPGGAGPSAGPDADARRAAAMSAVVPDFVHRAVVALQRYFAGRRIDFADIAVDIGGVGDLDGRAYELARRIPWGSSVTYGELARQLAVPDGARAVGRAMARNRVPIIIPCHRVVASGARLGGFSAPGGVDAKRRLLELEGIAPGGALLPLSWPRETA